jgi:hypothetical protein
MEKQEQSDSDLPSTEPQQPGLEPPESNNSLHNITQTITKEYEYIAGFKLTIAYTYYSYRISVTVNPNRLKVPLLAAKMWMLKIAYMLKLRMTRLETIFAIIVLEIY